MNNGTTEIQSRLVAAAQARQRGAGSDELRFLEEAIALAPTDPRVLNARGMRALADQEFAKAADHFRKAAALDPGEPALWMNLATAARGIPDVTQEREALGKVLDIDRFHFMGLLRKAELEQRAGTPGDATGAWYAVVQVASRSVDRPPVVQEALERGQAYLADQTRVLSDRIDAEFGAGRTDDQDLRRFNACVDHVLGRRPIYRNECHGVHYPFLPADEYFDRRLFPWMEQIESQTDAIRAEALAILESPGEALRPYVRMEKGTPANKWTPLDDSLDWGACFLWEYGVPNQPVLDRCPATAAALEALPRSHVPGKAPSAFFSILEPNAHIPPHTGVTNTRAIVHLPLVVPKGCWFRVGGETREWVEGQAFAFDDTIEHEALNPTGERRIILIFDVWNPHLTKQEQEHLVRFFKLQTTT